MGSVGQDLRYSLRALRLAPVFTLAASATLALGIGATVVIFSVLNALIFRPLPYDDPGRVAFVLGWDARRDTMRFNMSLPDVVAIDDASSAFTEVAAYRYWSANLTGTDRPERVQAYRVTADLFNLLGVAPALGRTFLPEEGMPGAESSVVLSHWLWRHRFAANPGIVGTTIALDGEAHTVIGVMPEGFEFPQLNFKGDLWTPLAFVPGQGIASRESAASVVAVGRLGPGIAPEEAQADVDRIAAQLERDHPQTNAGAGVRVMPMHDMIIGPARPAFLALAAAAAFVLLICCANVAGLLLARSLARRREIAIRSALGAPGRRIVRQLMTESLLLAAMGGGLGLLLAFWSLDLIRANIPDFIVSVMPAIAGLGIDGVALTFTLVLAAATGVLFGLVPALRAARADLSDALKESGRSPGASRQRLRGALVVAQVALSLVLLTGAALMMRSFLALIGVDAGFDTSGVLAMDLSLPQRTYDEPARVSAFWRDAIEGLASQPGIEAAGAVSSLPLSTSDSSIRFAVEGQAPADSDDPTRAGFRRVTPGYFRAMGILLHAGRDLSRHDDADGAAVAIVNAAFVRRFLADGSPIGRRLTLYGEEAGREIVGIVGDVRHVDLTQPPAPEIYIPVQQAPAANMTLVIRSIGRAAAPPADLARGVVARLDPHLPLYNVQPMEAIVSRSLFLQRAPMQLMIAFASIALTLAALGLYSVVSFMVSRRRHEIGVRVALGAGRRDILRLIVGRGMLLAGTGLVIGFGASLALGRALSGLLFGVAPSDPPTLAAVIALLSAVAWLASYLPARRAAAIDPAETLRNE